MCAHELYWMCSYIILCVPNICIILSANSASKYFTQLLHVASCFFHVFSLHAFLRSTLQQTAARVLEKVVVLVAVPVVLVVDEVVEVVLLDVEVEEVLVPDVVVVFSSILYRNQSVLPELTVLVKAPAVPAARKRFPSESKVMVPAAASVDTLSEPAVPIWSVHCTFPALSTCSTPMSYDPKVLWPSRLP